jgi:hypothetical protein
MLGDRMKKGTELTAAQQRDVLAQFAHRYTKEHIPAWARQPRPDGSTYPVQFSSDQDWLEHSRFAVTSTGKLDGRVKYCESNPTWPDNPELRNP